ncbi:hypothetical protein TRVL_08932 [Trypanosoma vivax]|nr:hypothetical protein TRVL_08932 [Trypanosoma vivax]
MSLTHAGLHNSLTSAFLRCFPLPRYPTRASRYEDDLNDCTGHVACSGSSTGLLDAWRVVRRDGCCAQPFVFFASRRLPFECQADAVASPKRASKQVPDGPCRDALRCKIYTHRIFTQCLIGRPLVKLCYRA